MDIRLKENKRQVIAPRYTQDSYPIIDLMFTLALTSKLYLKAKDEKGKLIFLKSPKLESFQSLNEYEKYTFLLQSYWTSYPFEEKFGGWFSIEALYDTLVIIVNSENGEIRLNEKKNIIDWMYSRGANFLHHLNFFGFGDLELIEGATISY